MSTLWKRLGVVASAMVLVGAVAAVASATGSSNASTSLRYSACVQASTKTLTNVVINKRATCSAGERQISWSATGPRGATGAAGVAGAAGTTWTTSSTAPTSTTGQLDGDLYLDVASGEVYEDVNGAWVGEGSLRSTNVGAGATGPAGPAGIAGAAGTNGTNGVAYDCVATPYPGIDLAGCLVDLSSTQNLSGANLTDANLLGGLFSGTQDFDGANLTGANFAGVYLLGATSVTFIGANLTDVNMEDLLPSPGTWNFTGANLTDANLTNDFFLADNFTDANLTGADLTGAQLVGVNFTNAILTGVITTPSTQCTDGNPGPCVGPGLSS